MRIALVIEQMDTARGGREVSTAQIAAAMARRGQQVTVVCQKARWQCEGVEVRALGARGVLRTARYRNFVADVERFVREARFDVVHTVGPVPGANFYQPRGGTLPGNAVARARQGGGAAFRQRVLAPIYFHRNMLGEMERRMVEDPRVTCLAVSEMVAEEFRVYYGRRDRLRVVYNGVDVPEVSPAQRQAWRAERRGTLGVSDQDTVFLCVAQNFGLKGVEETMLHFLRWCDSHGGAGSLRGAGKARLVVVGRGLLSAPHRSRRVREIQDRIRLVAWTPEIFSWYSAADACVLLSWYDACSRVVLEATRWGLPSITTAYNGAAEMLAEGAGVTVASPNDAEGVLAAMDAMNDPDRRAECSAACLRIAPRLSMDRHVEQLLEAYAAG
jgi:UDP-glucose:(heptosyl)LPS alpha-1,3-glucosyltransferase